MPSIGPPFMTSCCSDTTIVSRGHYARHDDRGGQRGGTPCLPLTTQGEWFRRESAGLELAAADGTLMRSLVRMTLVMVGVAASGCTADLDSFDPDDDPELVDPEDDTGPGVEED